MMQQLIGKPPALISCVCSLARRLCWVNIVVETLDNLFSGSADILYFLSSGRPGAHEADKQTRRSLKTGSFNSSL